MDASKKYNGWPAARSDRQSPATREFGKNRFIGRRDERALTEKREFRRAGTRDAAQSATWRSAPALTQPRVYASRALGGGNAARALNNDVRQVSRIAPEMCASNCRAAASGRICVAWGK